MNPSEVLGTLRPDLGTMMEMDLYAERKGFIALKVLPVIETAKQAGTYGRIPLEQLLKAYETGRTSEGAYQRRKMTFKDEVFGTSENGLTVPVDKRNEAIYAEYFDQEMVAAMLAMDGVIRNQEIRTAALLFNTTTWTGAALTTAITHEWDDATNAVPITDVNAAKEKIFDGTGQEANALIINSAVYRNLCLVDSIVERVESGGAGSSSAQGVMNAARLSQIFDLPYIVVAGGAKDTADEGIDRSISRIWSGEYAMVAKIAAPGDDITVPCLGRTFHWGEDGSQIGTTIESYPDPNSRANIIRARHETQEVVIYKECAHMLSNITT